MSWKASTSSSGVCAISRSTSPPSGRRRQVAALAVGLRAVGDLHQERQLLAREPGQDPRLEHGAEVVRVRHERVAVAALEQRRRACPSRRAPGRGRRARAAPTRASGSSGQLTGVEVVGAQLRDLVLHEVQRHVGLEVRVALERGQRVARAWRSCSSARAARARRSARAASSTWRDDDVEEGQPVLDLQQRLGAPSCPMLVPRPPLSLITTARSSARARPRRPSGSSSASGQRLDRLDLRLGQRPLLARLEPRLVAGEGLDGDLGQALGPHLLHGAVHGHDPMRLNAFGGSSDTCLEPAKEDPIAASPTDATTAAALAALRRMSFAVVDAADQDAIHLRSRWSCSACSAWTPFISAR